MNNIFLELVNISIMASWLVLVILLIRFTFKKIPKWITCILWGFVGLRLMLPFSIESTLSLIPSTNTIDITSSQSKPMIDSGIQIIDQNVNQYISSNYFEGVTVENGFFTNILSNFTIIWLIGIGFMFLYTFYSYYKIYRKTSASILLSDNVYLCDDIDTPFILGVINPRIYLPSDLEDHQMIHVLKHERAHLKRKDHFIKPIGFILLSIYWFNPILWLAYVLLCRDIEAACDEKVIQNMNNKDKKDYSETLFACSTQRNMILVCPLAFGEVGVKERIKSIIQYKKPTFWIITISLVLCMIVSITFLTVPKNINITEIDEENIQVTLLDNVNDVIIDEYRLEINEEKDVDEFVNKMFEIKISKNPISESRSEDRDKTHQIGIIYKDIFNHITYINFSRDYSEVWIDDGVKPTFSYKVKNINLVSQIFNSTPVIKNANESFNGIVIGFETNYMIVSPNANEKEFEKFEQYYVDVTGIDINDFKVGNEVEIVYDGILYKENKLNANGIYLRNNNEYDSYEDSFLNEVILNHYSNDKPTGLLRTESHVVLSNEGSDDANVYRDYLVVLYQEYSIQKNELIKVKEIIQPTVVEYKVDGKEYILTDYQTMTNEKEIKEVFPGVSADDAIQYSKYYDQLNKNNFDNTNDYFDTFVNRKEQYSDLLKEIKQYDNGYTDEDYVNAKGEDCLHPRIKYESGTIEIEIWSDPHRLQCYIVTIRNLDDSSIEKVYINNENYEKLCEKFDKIGLKKTYI